MIVKVLVFQQRSQTITVLWRKLRLLLGIRFSAMEEVLKITGGAEGAMISIQTAYLVRRSRQNSRLMDAGAKDGE